MKVKFGKWKNKWNDLKKFCRKPNLVEERKRKKGLFISISFIVSNTFLFFNGPYE